MYRLNGGVCKSVSVFMRRNNVFFTAEAQRRRGFEWFFASQSDGRTYFFSLLQVCPH
jgi:hypothetical protein